MFYYGNHPGLLLSLFSLSAFLLRLQSTLSNRNPWISRPLGALIGHNAAILDIVISETDNLLISLSADRLVKVSTTIPLVFLLPLLYSFSNGQRDELAYNLIGLGCENSHLLANLQKKT